MIKLASAWSRDTCRNRRLSSNRQWNRWKVSTWTQAQWVGRTSFVPMTPPVPWTLTPGKRRTAFTGRARWRRCNTLRATPKWPRDSESTQSSYASRSKVWSGSGVTPIVVMMALTRSKSSCRSLNCSSFRSCQPKNAKWFVSYHLLRDSLSNSMRRNSNEGKLFSWRSRLGGVSSCRLLSNLPRLTSLSMRSSMTYWGPRRRVSLIYATRYTQSATTSLSSDQSY